MTAFISAAFHVIIYATLRLIFVVQELISALSLKLRLRIAHRLQPSLNVTPSHIAFSGALSNHLPLVIDHIQTLVQSGTRHISLHDIHTPIPPEAVQHLLQSNPNQFAYTLIQLTSKSTTTNHIHVHPPKSAESPHQAPIILTLVHPACGPSLLTRATKHLIASPAFQTLKLSPQTVTEWLDKDPSNCMLPSEPDLLFIFPSSASTHVPVLNRFPVWQLRLTQLIFLPYPITKLTTQHLLQTAISASKAPKRFGR